MEDRDQKLATAIIDSIKDFPIEDLHRAYELFTSHQAEPSATDEKKSVCSMVLKGIEEIRENKMS